MLHIAVFLFIMAAIFGSIILFAILNKRPTPKPIVYIHGSIALVALLALIAGVATTKASTLLIVSVCLFILAALGGLTMLSLDIRKKPIPKSMALGHPTLALIALAILIISVIHLST